MGRSILYNSFGHPYIKNVPVLLVVVQSPHSVLQLGVPEMVPKLIPIFISKMIPKWYPKLHIPKMDPKYPQKNEKLDYKTPASRGFVGCAFHFVGIFGVIVWYKF